MARRTLWVLAALSMACGGLPRGASCAYDRQCMPGDRCGGRLGCLAQCTPGSVTECAAPLVCRKFAGTESAGYACVPE